MDHDIDVYERQDGDQLVHLKVTNCCFKTRRQHSGFTFRELYLQYTATEIIDVHTIGLCFCVSIVHQNAVKRLHFVGCSLHLLDVMLLNPVGWPRFSVR